MRPPRRSTAVLALLAVAVTASVAACGSEEVGGATAPTADAPTATAAAVEAPVGEGPTGDGAADGAGASTAPLAAAEELPVVPAEAGHLHGIGVDPADGRILLGTHVGLMAVGPDGVDRVGVATTDLMGFAVAGPQHYFASGHPGPGEEMPNPVGLIETTDGGLTWRSLSRGGQSDFHTLASGAGQVYGYDGVVRSSADGVSWQDGAGDVAPASLAVRPDEAGTVVATTQEGPVRSEDGGATFAALDGAPLLVLLSWVAPEELWGVDPDGGVHVSMDSGDSWALRGGSGGPPEAFTATIDGDVLVATGEHLLRSSDGGRSFDTIAHRG